MPSLPAGRRLAELVGGAHAFDDLDEFRQGILPLLREAVPSDYAAYNEFHGGAAEGYFVLDPVVTFAPKKLARFFEVIHQNPILEHVRVTGDGRPRRFSDFIDREALHQLEVWEEFYGPMGVESQVAWTLPSRPPVVLGIALSRGPNDFTDAEVGLLGAARPHLIQAYRTIELSTARAATIAALEAGLEAIGAPVLVVDGRGRIDMATPSARAMLEGGLGADGRNDRLAPWLVDALERRRESGAGATEPLVVRTDADNPLVIRVLAGPDGPRTDLLVFEGQMGGLSLVALEALGLRRREAEALRWLALGRRGPDIARVMGISPRTVDKHLQNVYAKLGVHSASQAAATAWAAVGVAT